MRGMMMDKFWWFNKFNGYNIEKNFSIKDGLDYNNIRTINQDINGNILIGGMGGFIVL